MKNKINLKRYLTIISLFIILFIIIIMSNKYEEYLKYNQNYNKKINNIVALIKKNNLTISEKELLQILNDDTNDDYLAKYGLFIDEDIIIKANTEIFWHYFINDLILILLLVLIIIGLFLKYNRKKDQEIKNITECIKEINKNNYELYIDTISEDELSILKNELYKITVNLKSMADNSLKDKINIKDSLQDISHQLKTPLTSIMIMIDNILDNEMDPKVQNDFLRDIKREVINIKFLVDEILKLAKIDANSVVFHKENIIVEDLINDVCKNVSSLSDLKNIDIIIKGKDAHILGDYKWQKEALTNILKNALEYSYDNSEIIINFEQNKIYTEIKIEDFGVGIKKEDLDNLFKRFYKGSNLKDDSVGIGMNLAKKIIEKDNGIVSIKRKNNGTIFTIKYFQNLL